MPVTDATLYAYASGALEPPSALLVEEALRSDALLRARLASLELEPTPPSDDPWRIPPPGIAGGEARFGMSWNRAAVFGGPLRPGDRFELRLGALEDSAQRVVVVLRRLLGEWTVVFPTDPESVLPLEDLPEVDGARVLEVSAGADRGLQRWAVALPHVRDPVDWSAAERERWAELVRAIAEGRIPVASTEVEVSG